MLVRLTRPSVVSPKTEPGRIFSCFLWLLSRGRAEHLGAPQSKQALRQLDYSNPHIVDHSHQHALDILNLIALLFFKQR